MKNYYDDTESLFGISTEYEKKQQYDCLDDYYTDALFNPNFKHDEEELERLRKKCQEEKQPEQVSTEDAQRKIKQILVKSNTPASIESQLYRKIDDRGKVIPEISTLKNNPYKSYEKTLYKPTHEEMRDLVGEGVGLIGDTIASRFLPQPYSSAIGVTAKTITQSAYDLVNDFDNASFKRFGSDFINNSAEELVTLGIGSKIKYRGDNPFDRSLVDDIVVPQIGSSISDEAKDNIIKNYGPSIENNPSYFMKLYLEELERLRRLR